MKASVIIPTYNERQTIRQVIPVVRAGLETAGYDHEVVVVDDDSPDETWRAVQEIYHTTDDVRCHRRTDEHGLSSAVLDGMQLATGDCYAVIDADLQHPPKRLPELVDHIHAGADIAIGSRFCEGGGVEDEWPLHRRVVSYGARKLAWTAIPARARTVSDLMSGFFAVRSSVVDPVADRLDPIGYKILLEILVRCPYQRVDEVPYEFRERLAGESSFDRREMVRYLRHLYRLHRFRLFEPAPTPVETVTDGGELECDSTD